MSLDVRVLKDELIGAGVEVYRTRGDELQIAERVRLHIMDSGIRVRCEENTITILVTLRAQRSDHPSEPESALFERVRRECGTPFAQNGYQEAAARTTPVTDPLDASRTLDVWQEVVFEKTCDRRAFVEDVRWALTTNRHL